MSTLILQLPEHKRLRARAAGEADFDPERRREYAYVTSTDGIAFEAQGAAAAALLPRRTQVIAVVRAADVSWHRITLPKAPAARLRAALVGVLEEALLDDAEAVHLALAPLATAGQPTWVAALDRAWLQEELATLQRSGVFVDRVVPMAWPDDPPTGHFDAAPAADGNSPADVMLTWSSIDGVATVRLDGGLARALVAVARSAGDTLDCSTCGRGAGRALARRARRRHGRRAASAAGRAQPLEPAPVRAGAADPRGTRPRRLDPRGDEPGLAAGAHRHRRARCGTDHRPQSLGLASAEVPSSRVAARCRRWSSRPTRASATPTSSATPAP